MPARELDDDFPDLPPLPELSPQLQRLADAIIEQGPLSLVALFGYIMEKTSQDAQWNAIIAEAMSSAGLSPDSMLGGPPDLDDGLIYKVKITLRGIRPAIFREVEVPNMTLGELHAVIQTAMGWEDGHQHCFTVGDEEYGELNSDDQYDPWLDEESISLGQLVEADQRKFTYEYDFGDSWTHDILISQPKTPQRGAFYPRCIKGELACPPEDCGGVGGYLTLCELLSTPKSEWSPDDEERMEWLGEFDPKGFSVDQLNAELESMYAPPEPPPKKKSKTKKK